MTLPNPDGLQKYLGLSLAVHLSLFGALAIWLNITPRVNLDTHYEISLVSVPAKKSGQTLGPKTPRKEKKAVTPPRAREEKKPAAIPKKTEKPEPDKSDSYARERIAALESKNRLKEKLSKEAQTPSAPEPIKRVPITTEPVRTGPLVKNTQPVGQGPAEGFGFEGQGGGQPGELSFYFGIISEEIWANWVFPDLMASDLSVIVSITIDTGGNIKVNEILQSSGDPAFDSSALEAIKKSSPVTPPPQILENRGMRFIL